jgi:RNA polymerase sigma-70 factor (subfamily 1)
MTNEEDLIALIRTGDENALALLLQEHREQLLNVIERKMSDRLRRKVDPEDVLQDAMTHCIKAFGDVDPATIDPIAWIHQVCERRLIDAHRHHFGAQKRDAHREVALQGGRSTETSPALIDMLINSFTTPSQAFVRGQREQKLLEAMQQLPEEQSRMLRMRYVEELPTKQIAERMNKTDGAIRVTLTRSIKRLEQLLEGEAWE